MLWWVRCWGQDWVTARIVCSDSALYISCSLLFATSVLNALFDLHDSLKNSRCAHASADAHRHHPVAGVAAFEFAQNRSSELRPSAAERVPEGDRAAIGIDARRINPQFLDHCE